MKNLQQQSQQFFNPNPHLSQTGNVNFQGVQLNPQVKMLVPRPQNQTGLSPRQEISNQFLNNNQLAANQPNSTAFYNQIATNGSPTPMIYTNQSLIHAENKNK